MSEPLEPVPAPVLLPLVDVLESAPPFALGEEEPEDCAFLAFLVFFLAFGFVSAVASAAPAEEPEVAPEEPLPVEDAPVVAPGAVDEPELASVDPVPLAPLVPDEPEVVSLAPDALEPVAPLLPEEPDADVPPVPAPVASVAFCDLTVDDGSEALLLPDCANAMDDTDATTISDRERRVAFNVMSNSF